MSDIDDYNAWLDESAAPPPGPEADPTWGDYGSAVTSATKSLGAGAASLLANHTGKTPETSFAHEMASQLRDRLNDSADADVEGMTASGKKRLQAEITSPEFWEHPISAAALKGVGFAPAITAAIIPGALVTEVTAAALVAAGVNGAINAGSVSNEIVKSVRKMSDAELEAGPPYYKQLKEMGFSEKEARDQLVDKLIGGKEALNFVVGAVAGAMGPAANLVRASKGVPAVLGGGSSRVANSALGAVENAGGMVAQNAVGDYSEQQAEQETGKSQGLDKHRLAEAVASGILFGGPLGAVTGATGRVHGERKPRTEDRVEENEPVVAPAGGPEPAPPGSPEIDTTFFVPEKTGNATDATPAPPESGPVSPTAAEPAVPSTAGAKGEAVKKKSKRQPEAAPEIAIVEATGPDATHTAALVPDRVPERPSAILHDERPPEEPEGLPGNAPAPGIVPEPTQIKAPVAEERLLPPEVTAPEPVSRETGGERSQDLVEAEAARDTAGYDSVRPEPTPEPAPAPEPAPDVTVSPPVEAEAPATPAEKVKRIRKKAAKAVPVDEPRLPGEKKIFRNDLPENVAAAKEINKKIAKNVADFSKHVDEEGNLPEQLPDKESKGGHFTKADKAKAETNAKVAKEVFDAHVPESDAFPEKEPHLAALQKRLTTMLAAAKEQGAKFGDRVTHLTSDEHAYMIAAASTLKALRNRANSFTDRIDAASGFVSAERAAKKGDFGPLREDRRLAGDLGHTVADVEAVHAAKVTAESNAPKPTVGSETPSKVGLKVNNSEEKPGSAVRKPKLSQEELDRLVGKSNEAVKKKGVAEEDLKNIKGEEARADVEKEAFDDKEAAAAEWEKKLAAEGLSDKLDHPEGNYETGVKITKQELNYDTARLVQTVRDLGKHEREWMYTEGEDVDRVLDRIKRWQKTGEIPPYEVALLRQKLDRAIEAGKKDGRFVPAKETGEWGRGYLGGEWANEHAPDVYDGFTGRHDQKTNDNKDRMTGGPNFAKLVEVRNLIRSLDKTGVSDKLTTKPKYLTDKFTKKPLQPKATIPARDALASLRLDHLTDVPKALADFARRQLTKLVGDTEVHIANKFDFARLTGDLTPAFEADGEGYRGAATTYLDGSGGHVIVRADALKTPAGTAHTVLHEVTHIATQRALHEDPVIHQYVERMMGETKEFLKYLPDLHGDMAYALTNAREFIAEAFSNPKVQEILSHISLSDKLARELGLHVAPKKSTLWDGMIAMVRQIVEKTTGRIPEGHSIMEGVLRTTEFMEKHNAEAKGPLKLHGLQDGAHLTDKLTRQDIRDLPTNLGGHLRTMGKRLSHFEDLVSSRTADALYGGRENNPLRAAAELRGRQSTAAEKILKQYHGSEAPNRLAAIERSKPAQYAEAVDLYLQASRLDIKIGEPLSEQGHLGKNAHRGFAGKQQLNDLNSRFAVLDPDVRAAFKFAERSFRAIHNAVGLQTIKNILHEAGVLDEANLDRPGTHGLDLAEKIFDGTLTDVEKKAFGDKKIVEMLDSIRGLKKREGTYIPFRRFGDYLSIGRHELEIPNSPGVSRINDNTIQFFDTKKYGDAAAHRMAEAYLRRDSHTPQGEHLVMRDSRKVWVDKNDPSKILDSTDVDARPAWQITMQTDHMEMHDTLARAQRAEQNMIAAGLVDTSHTKRTDAHGNAVQIQGAMTQILKSLEQSERYQSADPAVRQAMRQTFQDLTLGLSGNTTVKSSMKDRQNVGGMSDDLVRVAADYHRMAANYLAALQYRPRIDAEMAKARKYRDERKDDGNRLTREELYNETSRRLYGDVADRVERPNTTAYAKAVAKLNQISRIARLGGVSFHVINSTEPFTTTMPIIGGRFGFARANYELAKAYNTIGGLGHIGSGLRDTVRAYNHDTGFTDYVKVIKDNIAKRNDLGGGMSFKLMDVIDAANERGLFGNSSIYEQGRQATPTSGSIGRFFDRADLMANQVGTAIEANNRAVSLIAAYKLELRKNGGNHEAAKAYAYDVTRQTMGNYAAWAAAPVFNTSIGRTVGQFKKYAHKSYSLLGRTFRDTVRGDPEAAKQFVGLMVTHAVVAGALGLPGLELAKVAIMAAGWTGVIGFGWDDVEDAVRGGMAAVLGKTGGEVASRGLTRLIGVETSQRMGWDSLLSGLGPRSNKTNDIKAYLWDTAAGAPIGFIMDQFEAARALMNGDIHTAFQKAVPIRALSDIDKAVQGAMGPTKTAAGGEKQPQMTPWQVAVRTAGFTPSAQAEHGAMHSTFTRQSKDQSEKRVSLEKQWVDASPSERSKLWGRIVELNRSLPPDAQLTRKQLDQYVARKAKEKTKIKDTGGIVTSKSNKHLYDRASGIYN